VIQRRFRNDQERKSGLEQIKGALQLGEKFLNSILLNGHVTSRDFCEECYKYMYMYVTINMFCEIFAACVTYMYTLNSIVTCTTVT